MSLLRNVVVLASTLCVVACASSPKARLPSDVLAAVDGTASFNAPPDRVRLATLEALRGLGYDIAADADAGVDVVRTQPRVEHVSRWDYLETKHPNAVAAATVAAVVVAGGGIPVAVSHSGGGEAVSLDVDYTFTLAPAPDDPATTVVVLTPHAVNGDGADCTDRYLALVDTHHAWSAIFDAIDAALAETNAAPDRSQGE